MTDSYQVEGLKFVTAGEFSWDANTRTLSYDPSRVDSNAGRRALLHELGHALLGHEHGDLADRRDEMERHASELGAFLAERLAVSV